MNTESPKDNLIVALDVNAADEALSLVSTLKEHVGMFKVGSQLFTSNGPDLVKRIVATGAKVFLDLKFHDIPHQVAGAAAAATELGISMFTIHASGGTEMMHRAVEASADLAAKRNLTRPFVVAVTVLTSIDDAVLDEIGVVDRSKDAVLRLARLAEVAGVDGVVASPQEAQAIRSSISKPNFLIVTPGIRPEGKGTADDQKRVATPRLALRAGTDFLVVGRPITEAVDPTLAAIEILTQIETASELNAAELTQSGGV
ncbi:MAG: orotidine-5'-phosphate decarboxylase [Blastocatellia bacterium]|nr:MAG: orotidine-5'-phosphate decarboxylase [Blastocatellia bacterium]